jgi:hypothetical protein
MGNPDAQKSTGYCDIFITKYGGNGTRLCTRLSGTPVYDVGYCLASDTKANMYLTGITEGALDGQKVLRAGISVS